MVPPGELDPISGEILESWKPRDYGVTADAFTGQSLGALLRPQARNSAAPLASGRDEQASARLDDDFHVAV
ncbi:MAG: hypothetical protein DMF89_18880, partial [Acidobacteria bacterium]